MSLRDFKRRLSIVEGRLPPNCTELYCKWRVTGMWPDNYLIVQHILESERMHDMAITSVPVPGHAGEAEALVDERDRLRRAAASEGRTLWPDDLPTLGL